MIPCNEHSAKISQYLDNKLHDKNLENFLAHLRTCVNCRRQLSEERALSDLLRMSRPIYSAPAELRARISASLVRYAAPDQPIRPFHRSVVQTLAGFMRGATQWAPRFNVLVPTVLVIMICLVLIPNAAREVRAASYVETAVSAHRSYLVATFR